MTTRVARLHRHRRQVPPLRRGRTRSPLPTRIVPAFVIDAETGRTVGRFGLDATPSVAGTEPPYRPERWALARCYTLSAQGPGGHAWPAWAGALAMLLATVVLIGTHL